MVDEINQVETDVTPVVESQEAQPTPEVNAAELQETVKRLELQARQFEDNWKNEARVKSKREQEIQELKTRLESKDNSDAMFQALLALQAKQMSKAPDELEDEVKENKSSLVQEFQAIKKKLDEDNKVKSFMAKVTEYQSETEALGLKPGDTDYDVVKSLVETGKFAVADKKLAELKARQPVAPQTPPSLQEVKPSETVAPAIDREKIAIEYMKEKGLLKSGIKPSGSGSVIPTNVAEFRTWVTEHPDEYRQNKEKVYEMQRKGLIK